jgi:hypothetical protein
MMRNLQPVSTARVLDGLTAQVEEELTTSTIEQVARLFDAAGLTDEELDVVRGGVNPQPLPPRHPHVI